MRVPRLLRSSFTIFPRFCDNFATPKPLQSRCYAAKTPTGAGSIGAKIIGEKEDKGFIESDARLLARHVCVNYFVEGEEPGPAIKPDSEYPSWLFSLDVRPARELEDLDPDVDGWLYWRALRMRQMEQARRHKKLFYLRYHLQNSPTLARTKRTRGERPIW